jgi:hypothetical protein
MGQKAPRTLFFFVEGVQARRGGVGMGIVSLAVAVSRRGSSHQIAGKKEAIQDDNLKAMKPPFKAVFLFKPFLP